VKVFIKIFLSAGFIALTSQFAFSANKAIETNYYYKINKGDTMWDISKRYYGNPYKWRSLYKKNKKVYNPNLIFPDEFLLLNRKIIIENAPENAKELKHYSYFYTRRSEFILKKVAGSVEPDENLSLSAQLLKLEPYKKLKKGEIITLIRKRIENGVTVALPVGYARVVAKDKAVAVELFDEIGEGIYFVPGIRKPIPIIKQPVKAQRISILGNRYLSIFTGSTLWGRIKNGENRLGSVVNLIDKNSGQKVASGIITSQNDNLIGITITELYREYEPGNYIIRN